MKKFRQSSPVLWLFIFCAAAVLPRGLTAGTRDDLHKSFKVAPGGTLTIDSRKGSIEIRGGGKDSVEIEVQREVRLSGRESARDILEKLPIEFDQRGNDVFVKAEYRDGRLSRFWNDLTNRLKIKYIVTVPTEYNLDCRTRGGGISVTGVKGRVAAETSGGGLSFDSVIGPIEGETSGGSIRIGEVDGLVRVHTSGGGIRIERARGEVNARTSGGSITVEEVMGAITAKTSGGSVKAAITRQPEHACRLQTSGGSVTVYLTEDVGVKVDAHTSGGSVHTDFPVKLQGTIRRNDLQAEINGGGPELYLRTSGGSISIRKK